VGSFLSLLLLLGCAGHSLETFSRHDSIYSSTPGHLPNIEELERASCLFEQNRHHRRVRMMQHMSLVYISHHSTSHSIQLSPPPPSCSRPGNKSPAGRGRGRALGRTDNWRGTPPPANRNPSSRIVRPVGLEIYFSGTTTYTHLGIHTTTDHR
jgi:hypothetical protein